MASTTLRGAEDGQFYFDKIWDYIQANPKATYGKPIADILYRFRDRPKPK
jgi:hypothetical protein